MPVQDQGAAAARAADRSHHVLAARKRLEAVDLGAEVGEPAGDRGLAGSLLLPPCLLHLGADQQLRVLGAVRDELLHERDELVTALLDGLQDGVAHGFPT